MEEENSIKFKTNLINLCDLLGEIIDYVKNKNFETDLNSGVINIGKMVIESKNSIELIIPFIKKSYNYWEFIYEKNEDFLINNCFVLFEGIPENYIIVLKEILERKDLIDDEIRENLWEVIQALVVNCIKHIHIHREFSEEKQKYTKTYFPDVSIKKEFERWKIKK
jgi:hypothetical protein